jgi:hypothetical protein
MTSLEAYQEAWAETQNLSAQELEQIMNESVHFSADLTEATYTIPFEVLDANLAVCDEVMVDFNPWNTFRDVFGVHTRIVDMSALINKGLWEGPVEVTSTRGSFMGDGLSFIHLTLLLGGLVASVFQANGVRRPLGQSVGDDLVLLHAMFEHCIEFCFNAESLGCQFSKLNSISEDSLTFCEQYVARISNLEIYKDIESFKNSIFADLVFLDNIKGSLLSGRSKVMSNGSSPFIGHATMLNKVARWHPIGSTRERSKTFLWASNFMEARRLGSSLASLPPELGGLDIALGTVLTFQSEKFQQGMLPYYEAMLDLERGEFLKYSLLLRGIYKSNPKGFTWENDWKVIRDIVEGVELVDISDINQVVPEELKGEEPLVKLNYIRNELKMVSFDYLSDHLARRDAFHKMWNGILAKEFMTLKISNVKKRVNHAWAIIKSTLEPKEVCTSRSMSHLAHRFRERSWGLYVSTEDEAIKRTFGGMPTLEVDNSVYNITEYHSESSDDNESMNIDSDSSESSWE